MGFTIIFFIFLGLSNSWAIKLSDYRPYGFESLFTNPVCATYKYQQEIVSHSGKILNSKPSNVYCKPSDESSSVSRKDSPQYRLIEWILSKETKEIHAAYLSFSSKNVVSAFCSSLKNGTKMKLILDRGEGPEVHFNKDAENLKNCGNIQVIYRGHSGGLGYAHNKILMINPNDPQMTKIVFSSGNMTSGTSINHENWNFVTTSSQSYFSQVHNCVLNAMIEAGESKKIFKEFLNQCRSSIKAEPESDISVSFSPVDGKFALEKITKASIDSEFIQIISHRLSGVMLGLFKDALINKKRMSLILDDDIYWSEKLKKDVGRNSKIEAFRIYNELINKGMNTKFLETNQNVYQLQHNKFIIFNFAQETDAVFSGAGNLTSAAFNDNFEKMATAPEDMPRDYLMP